MKIILRSYEFFFVSRNFKRNSMSLTSSFVWIRLKLMLTKASRVGFRHTECNGTNRIVLIVFNFTCAWSFNGSPSTSEPVSLIFLYSSMIDSVWDGDWLVEITACTSRTRAKLETSCMLGFLRWAPLSNLYIPRRRRPPWWKEIDRLITAIETLATSTIRADKEWTIKHCSWTEDNEVVHRESYPNHLASIRIKFRLDFITE